MTSNIPPATQADLDAHTEQALVELVYVRTANEILGASVLNLESALNVSQSVLNILQALQNIKNYITVSSPGTFNFSYIDAGLGRALQTFTTGNVSHITIKFTNVGNPPGTPGSPTIFSQYGKTLLTNYSANLSNYARVYQAAASAYFGTPINPSVLYPSGQTAASTLFTNLQNNLAAMITRLSAITDSTARDDPGTLLYQLKIVQTDMAGGMENWIKDSYDTFTSGGSADAGKFQSNLTTAITASQSLNDTQKEDIRRFLFIFQEYYQSASAVLSKITQIIEKMAGKISQ